jgi:hypothetical protein
MAVALIRYGTGSWELRPGGTLTFGRGTGCDIRLTDDQHLSRRAGALLGQDGYVVIRNDSASKPIVLRPPAGEDRVVEPAAATTSLPLRHFDLVLYGANGAPVVLHVDAGPPPPPPDWLRADASGEGSGEFSGRGSGEGSGKGSGKGSGEGSGTVTAPITLTPTQRRVLLALCEPMLTLRGPAARPSTYAEIGRRLGLKQGYVRNVVKALRESLTGHGLAGLSEEAADAAVDDFRRALAQWAVRLAWVSVDQISELEGHKT